MDKDVEELLSRSVKEIIPSKESLKEVLLSGKKLRVYKGHCFWKYQMERSKVIR